MADPRTFQIDEQETGLYTAIIVGNDGVTPLPGPILTTLTLTLYVIPPDGTPAIINNRQTQDVLNANNVAVSAGGLLTWLVQVGDTTLLNLPPVPYERHIALFEWTWPGGAGKHEVVLVVRNLLAVA
jgi:hypothetical protein